MPQHYAKFQRDPPSGPVAISEKLTGFASTPLHLRGLRQRLATHSQETQQWSVGARPPLVQWRLAGNGPDLNSTEKLGAVL